MTPMYADRGHDAAVPCALVGYSARMTPVPESMLRKQSQFLVGGVAGARPSRAACGRRSGWRRGASWLTCAVLFCFLVVIGCSKQETAPPSPSADAPIVQPARAPAAAAPKADAPGTAAELPEGEHPPDDEVAAEAVAADDKPTASEDGSGNATRSRPSEPKRRLKRQAKSRLKSPHVSSSVGSSSAKSAAKTPEKTAAPPSVPKPAASTPAAQPAAKRSGQPAKRTVVPTTAHVRAQFPSGLQKLLDADPRMQPWVTKVMGVAERCHQKTPSSTGVIKVRVTMHKNARPSAAIRSLPPALSGLLACASGSLMGARMPLFTGPEGAAYDVSLNFTP